MILYKLTDRNLVTHKGFTYTPGVWTPEVSGNGDLCGPGWYHAYTHPGLALLLNPIHANYSPCRLWEAEGEIGLTDRGLKVGVRRLRLTHELVAPSITAEQCITFALYAALAVCFEPTFVAWAEGWLAGTDRSEEAAARATKAAEAVADVAARTAARTAWAAEAVARAAARTVTWAAEAAAQVAAWAAGWAAEAAAEAAAAQLVAWADAALVGVTWERKGLGMAMDGEPINWEGV
jgi:hypothetical protein